MQWVLLAHGPMRAGGAEGEFTPPRAPYYYYTREALRAAPAAGNSTACTHMHMHTHTRTRTHAYAHTRTHTRTQAHTRPYAHTHHK